MRKNNLENEIQNAFTALTPDVCDQILFRAEHEKGRDPMQNTEKRKSAKILKIALIAAAALLVCAVIFAGGAALGRASARPALITESQDPTGSEELSSPADNPTEPGKAGVRRYGQIAFVPASVSAEEEYTIGVLLQIYSGNKTLRVSACKGEGEKLIAIVSYAEAGLEETVREQLLKAAEDGYISEERNLISVFIDQFSLHEKVSEAIENALDALIEKGILSDGPRLTSGADPAKMFYLKKAFGVTLGHAKYALLLAEKDQTVRLNDLLKLSADEVKSLCAKKGIDAVYPRFGAEAAEKQVFSQLGVRKEDVEILESGIVGMDDMNFVRLEFRYGGTFSYYLFDAQSAQLLVSKSFKELEKDRAIALTLDAFEISPDLVEKSWVKSNPYLPLGNIEGAKLVCTVSLRCSDGIERMAIVDSETGAVDYKHTCANRVHEEEFTEIVEKDIGAQLGEYGVAHAYHYTSPCLVTAAAGYNGVKYAYIIDYRTGEILYKESFDANTKSHGVYCNYSEEYAKKAAVLTAEFEGAKDVKVLECTVVKNGSYDPKYYVLIEADGVEHTCFLSCTQGMVQYE